MTKDSISSKLTELFELYKSGALNKEEYENLKNEIFSKQDKSYIGGDDAFEIEKKNQKESIEQEKNTKHTLHQTEKENNKGNNKSSIIKTLIVIISGLVLICVFLFLGKVIMTNSNKVINQTEVNKIEQLNDKKQLGNTKIKYNEAKIEVDKVLKEDFDKDYFEIEGSYPDDCSLQCDTILIIDLNKDGYFDILASYWGEDGIYGNTPQQGWIVLKNNVNSYVKIPNSIHYQFSLSKLSNDTLIGTIYQRFDSDIEVKYVFKNNDFVSVYEHALDLDESNEDAIVTSEQLFNDDNLSIDRIASLRELFLEGYNQTPYNSYSKHTYKMNFNAPYADEKREYEPAEIKNGYQRRYFINSEDVYIQRKVENDIVTEVIYFHPDGRIYNITNIENGKPNGKVKFVDLDNYVILEGEYREGKLVGYWNTPVLGNFNTQDNRVINQYPGIVNQMLTLINFYSFDKDTRIFKMN